VLPALLVTCEGVFARSSLWWRQPKPPRLPESHEDGPVPEKASAETQPAAAQEEVLK